MGWRRRGVLGVLVAFVWMLGALVSDGSLAGAIPTPGASPPVIEADAPDPEVVFDGTLYWMFTTQVYLHTVPVRSSTDLRTWSAPTEALPQLPAWADWGFTWSPGVERFGSTYVMYYTARYRAAGVQCIGRAVASAPGGPYVDASSAPFICQGGEGGSIDADPYRAPDGSVWLLWKTDGNAIGVPSRIYVVPLSADGSAMIGPVNVLATSTAGDRGIIENPTMASDGMRTYLMFSAGEWWTAGYRMERAICVGPAGPCSREVGHWVGATSGLVGPGGGALFQDAGGAWQLAVHGWRGAVGYENGGVRAPWIGPVHLDQAPVWYLRPPPNSTSWYLRDTAGAGPPDRAFPYGTAGNVGLACDWDGLGGDSNGVFEAGRWYLRNEPNGGAPNLAFAYGTVDYVPVCGDWDGNGTDTIGVFTNGHWYLRNSNTPGPPDLSVAYGTGGYVPVIGDWDGNGTDTIGVFTYGHWYLRNSNTPGPPDLSVDYGAAWYVPVIGDWDGNGTDTIGVFTNGQWYLRDTNTPGPPNVSFRYGDAGYTPVVGDWGGNGTDDVGVLVR